MSDEAFQAGEARIETCCVTRCPNTPLNSKVKFFDFPNLGLRSYQRNRWVQAIKNKNGYWWMPSAHSLICSDHFVKGKPSQDYKDADYVPTIFSVTRRAGKPDIKSRSLSVKKFALEYIKYDALLEKPSRININNEHRKCAYVLLAKSLDIPVATVCAWERRFRKYFEEKIAETPRNKRKLTADGTPHWMSTVEARLHTPRPSRPPHSVSPGGVVLALCAAARARGSLCSTALYNDVRCTLRLSCGINDLHAVWVTAQRVSLEQVLVAGRAGDTPEAAAPSDAVRVADLVLLHTDVDMHRLVTDESLTLYEESGALHTLWQLVQRHRLEEAAPPGSRVRAQRWSRAYRDYRRSGRAASLIVLQRRWHELKLQARERLAAHWQRAPAPHPLYPRPKPLHLTMLKRYPHIVTSPLKSWRQLVLDGLVVMEPLENEKNGKKRLDKDDKKQSTRTIDDPLAEQPLIDELKLEQPAVEPSAAEGPTSDAASAATPDTSSKQAHRAEDDSNDIILAEFPISSDTDTDNEDKLVIDECSNKTPCAFKLEPGAYTEIHSTDNTALGNIAPTVEVLHMIDPSMVKTEILFESDEDDFKPYNVEEKFEIELETKKDASFISNRIMFDDEEPGVSCNITGDIHVKTEGDVTAAAKGVADVAGVGGVTGVGEVTGDDVTGGADLMDNIDWDGDQKMDDRVNGRASIDPKLLMDTTIKLIRIDKIRAWKKYSRDGKTIRVSRIHRKLYTPNIKNVAIELSELKVSKRCLLQVANTHHVRQFCRNIKRELIDEQMNHETLNKKTKTESESDDDKPLLAIREGNTPRRTTGDTELDRLEEQTTEESSSEDEFFNDEMLMNMRGEEKRIRSRSAQYGASTIEWSSAFVPVFGNAHAQRVAKRVQLPDIEQVRRDNSNMQVAQVAPITAHQAGGEDLCTAELPPSDVTEGDTPTAWHSLSLPSGDQLLTALDKLTTLAAAEHVLEAAQCCAARRHRVVNDTRRRIGFPELPLHAHADGVCSCCCAHLCDASARRRLDRQLRALHADIARLLRRSSETTKCKSKMLRKRSRTPSRARAVPATDTTAAHTHQQITNDTPPLNTTTVATGTKAKTASEARGSMAKPVACTSRSQLGESGSNRQPAPRTAPPTPTAADYEEWQRQKNMNAQYFYINSGNVSSKKHKSTTARTTTAQSTTAQSTAAQSTTAQSTTVQSTTAQNTTAPSSAPPNVMQAGTLPYIRPSNAAGPLDVAPPVVAASPALAVTRTIAVPTVAATSPTDAPAGPKRLVVGHVNTTRPIPAMIPIARTPAANTKPVEEKAANESQTSSNNSDNSKLTAEPLAIHSYKGKIPIPRCTKPSAEHVPERSLAAFPPQTHRSRGANTVSQPAATKPLSILEEYSRTLNSAPPANAVQLPAVNALSLQLPGSQGPQTTIIMALTLPTEKVIQRPVNTLYANDTVDLTADSGSSGAHLGGAAQGTQLLDISGLVKRLVEPLNSCARDGAPKIMSTSKKLYDGDVIEIDDSDSNHSGNSGDHPSSKPGGGRLSCAIKSSDKPNSSNKSFNKPRSSNKSSNKPRSSNKSSNKPKSCNRARSSTKSFNIPTNCKPIQTCVINASSMNTVSGRPCSAIPVLMSLIDGSQRCPAHYANVATMTEFMKKLRASAAAADTGAYCHKAAAPRRAVSELPCGGTLLCVDASQPPLLLPARGQRGVPGPRDHLVLTDADLPCAAPTYWTFASFCVMARIVPDELADDCGAAAGDASGAGREERRDERDRVPRERKLCQKNHNFKILTAFCSADGVRQAARAGAALVLLHVLRARLCVLTVRRDAQAGRVRHRAVGEYIPRDLLQELERMLDEAEREEQLGGT